MSLEWEQLEPFLFRAKVPGGWLVKLSQPLMTRMHEGELPTTGYEWQESITYVPDKLYEWRVDR